MVKKIVTFPFIFLIRAYQVILSPHMGHSCRFQPTCSNYMIQALEIYGLKGLGKGIKRVLRCNPWGGFGYDVIEKHETKAKHG